MQRFFALGMILMISHFSPVSRNITFDDLYGMPRFGDIRISPDGRQVVFAVTVNDPDEDAPAAHLWLLDGITGETRQLTFGEHDNRGRIESGEIAAVLGDALYGDPTVSPDGSYLLATRSRTHEPEEIYRYDNGGFMVNWMCGHTDRFRCLISIDGTCNRVSSFGSTEELRFPEWEFMRGTASAS